MTPGSDRTAMNPRTCIVTRQERTTEEMIRFVLDPENRVVPDIRRKLPGRGVWVTANQDLVAKAARKGVFARGFKAEAKADHDLAETVGELLDQAALDALGMAKKAGLVAVGHDKIAVALKKGAVSLLLHASDAASGSRKKLGAIARSVTRSGGGEVEISQPWPGEVLDRALGMDKVVHVALMDGGATESFRAKMAMAENYRKPGG